MIMISKDFFLSITRDFSDPYVRPTLHVGIGTGNPGVSQGYPYPYPRKPVPWFKGTGFTGYGYGFSPKITHLWNKNKIKNLYIKKQSKFSPDYGPNDIIGLLTMCGHQGFLGVYIRYVIDLFNPLCFT